MALLIDLAKDSVVETVGRLANDQPGAFIFELMARDSAAKECWFGTDGIISLEDCKDPELLMERYFKPLCVRLSAVMQSK